MYPIASREASFNISVLVGFVTLLVRIGIISGQVACGSSVHAM